MSGIEIVLWLILGVLILLLFMALLGFLLKLYQLYKEGKLWHRK